MTRTCSAGCQRHPQDFPHRTSRRANSGAVGLSLLEPGRPAGERVARIVRVVRLCLADAGAAPRVRGQAEPARPVAQLGRGVAPQLERRGLDLPPAVRDERPPTVSPVSSSSAARATTPPCSTSSPPPRSPSRNRVELRPIRLHDLRHGRATMALQAEVHPKAVQERLGHASIGITLDVYSHVTAGLCDDAAEWVAGLRFGAR